jgi:hypothetical protein
MNFRPSPFVCSALLRNRDFENSGNPVFHLLKGERAYEKNLLQPFREMDVSDASSGHRHFDAGGTGFGTGGGH